ncbi:hypothetical protein [Micromonospora schwarzwaldensis]|uniref:hypothetical protein n=1 Tax=Micromonospora sp. DSM 45708 TaxID=3111767 RepID=UPI0031DAD51E
MDVEYESNDLYELSAPDDLDWLLYRSVLDGGVVTDLGALRAELRLSEERFEECLERMRRLRLLRVDATGGLSAVRPDVAATDVVDPLERQIVRLRAEADRMRENFSKLTSVYHHHRERQLRRTGAGVLAIPEDAGVNFIISEIVNADVAEVSLLHPGPTRFGGLLDQMIAEAPALSERGVTLRVVYGAGASGRDEQALRACAVEAGYEARLVPEVAGAVAILHEQAAFIPTVAADAGEAVVVVRQATVLEVLCGAFEQHWSAAARLTDDRTPEPTDGDEVKRRILELLVQGARDETIARRVGISVRTCRKYVARILHEAGAQSRFQAGYLLGDASERECRLSS